LIPSESVVKYTKEHPLIKVIKTSLVII